MDQISTTNCCHGWWMYSTTQRAPRHSDITNELLWRVMDGWDNPNSTYGLRNHQRTALTGDTLIQANSPYGSDIINEQLSRVTHVFNSPKSPSALRYHQRTAVTGDGWMRQPKQHLRTQKSSTNCSHGWSMDSTSPNTPYGLRNHQPTALTGDAWSQQPQQTLGAQIS